MFPNLEVTSEFFNFETESARLQPHITAQDALIVLADETVSGADSDTGIAVNLLRLGRRLNQIRPKCCDRGV